MLLGLLLTSGTLIDQVCCLYCLYCLCCLYLKGEDVGELQVNLSHCSLNFWQSFIFSFNWHLVWLISLHIIIEQHPNNSEMNPRQLTETFLRVSLFAQACANFGNSVVESIQNCKAPQGHRNSTMAVVTLFIQASLNYVIQFFLGSPLRYWFSWCIQGRNLPAAVHSWVLFANH